MKKAIATSFLWLSFLMPIAAQENSKEFDAYVAGQNRFGFSLIKALGTPSGNLCLSPFNISSALELAYIGAEGDTKSEMSATLGLPSLPVEALCDNIKDVEDFWRPV